MQSRIWIIVCCCCLTVGLFCFPGSLLATDPPAGSMTELTGKAATMVEQLDINSASVEALSAIPGIGPKIGEAIGAYRDAHGAFSSISDLLNVEGIDATLLEQIKPFLKI